MADLMPGFLKVRNSGWKLTIRPEGGYTIMDGGDAVGVVYSRDNAERFIVNQRESVDDTVLEKMQSLIGSIQDAEFAINNASDELHHRSDGQ